eukprot:CAMPEP_0204339580 /NCGR_PEP_ID=MMETSP0469-20131031/21915_1 /ASSEMBLY_ACC=CAM_ASM_000384 /TAXON_ID=2969 /ORGANISM="Oxyrrhis marina" /LENGTH=31 /DNA_ID= /DNA_START= /DNA_END= /DNA_ORIENTATION=
MPGVIGMLCMARRNEGAAPGFLGSGVGLPTG